MGVNPVLHEGSQAVRVGLAGGSKIVKLRLGYEQPEAQFPPLPLHLPELLHDIVCGKGGVWTEEGDGDSQLRSYTEHMAPMWLVYSIVLGSTCTFSLDGTITILPTQSVRQLAWLKALGHDIRP